MGRLAGRVGIGLGVTFMLAVAMVVWLLPNRLIGLFLDHDDPAFRGVIDLAVSLLAVAAWFELFDGAQTIAMGCIRGLKDAKTTFLVGLGCYWLIGAPAAWWMAFHLNWGPTRSEEHTSELQSLMRNSYAVFCLTKKRIHLDQHQQSTH